MAERLDPAVRRARILETAMQIITDEGYRGLTLRGLARRCGMTAPGLMHHFPDLPTLLMAVLDYRDEQTAATLVVDPGNPPSAREYLDRIVDGIVARPRAAQLFAIVEGEAIDPSHPAHQYFVDRANRVMQMTPPAVAREFADPEGFLRRAMAIFDGLQLHYLRDPEHFDIQAHWKVIADALFAAERGAH